MSILRTLATAVAPLILVSLAPAASQFISTHGEYAAYGITGGVLLLTNLKKISATLVSISGDTVLIAKNIEATTAIFPQIARNWCAFKAALRGRKSNRPNKSK